MSCNNFTVTIIIPTFKRLDILKKSVAAVLEMEKQPIEILVVCRPDDDPVTYQWLIEASREIQGLKVLTISIPGQVQAMNAAIPVARGDIVAILDDDALPRKDWLTQILKCYKDSRVGAVGGRDVVHQYGKICDTPQAQEAGVRTFWGTIKGNHHLVIGTARSVDVIKGCNLTFRRSAVAGLKFDDRLLGKGAQVGNDSWFSLCVKVLGFDVILNPQAIVDHYPAERADGAREVLSKEKCFEQAVNNVALTVANMRFSQKVRFIIFSALVGFRYCPGLYYLSVSFIKRPLLVPVLISGGWSGFIGGMRLARILEESPPRF